MDPVDVARWTDVDIIVKTLRRRWTSGALLRMHTGVEAWKPISVPITGPRASELAGAFDEVRDWAGRWATAEAKKNIRLDRRTIGGRVVGQNSLPARAHVDALEAVWALLGVTREVETFDDLVTQTPEGPLREWARNNPMQVLNHAAVWPMLLSAAAWIQSRSGEGRYLRQIDAHGVDTKFVGAHKAILSRLLDTVLPSERVDSDASVGAFERRYGFAVKPAYIRWRHLGRAVDGYSEMTVRSDELATHPPVTDRVFVVENEISFLALPECSDAIAIFGAGFNLSRFAEQRWMTDVSVDYWGDLDSHGFAILHEFRKYVPHATSMLMDHSTLMAHRPHWTQDPSPTHADLHLLTAAEREVYEELVTNVHGDRVRLEQERIRFSLIEDAMS